MILIMVPTRLFRNRFSGIALWPFIVVKDKHCAADKTLINHERIHLRQQIELCIVPFYLWYSIEYIVRLVHYKNRHLAYRNISFEREAYAQEHHLEYLKDRKFWKFLSYV